MYQTTTKYVPIVLFQLNVTSIVNESVNCHTRQFNCKFIIGVDAIYC